MKKAMLASVILLVVSLVSTVCFGVALGAQGLRALFGQSGLVQDWAQSAVEWRDAVLYTADILEENENMRLFSRESEPLPAAAKLEIDAQVGNILLLPSETGAASAVLEQWSDRKAPSAVYTLSVSGNKISLAADDTLDGTVALLKVYLPQEVRSVTAKTALGSISFGKVSLTQADLQTQTGGIVLESGGRVQTASVYSAVGAIAVSDAFTVTDSLTLTNDCGDVELGLPQKQPFTLHYTVETGTVETDAELPAAWQHSVQTAGSRRTGSLENSEAALPHARYQVQIGVGNLELDYDIILDA